MAGMTAIGIDHFARPRDGLARAQAEGRLHRNFQGYTDDGCTTLIGLGASSISRFPGRYVQNAPATAAYQKCIAAGEFAGFRGHALSPEDRLRAAAIERLMCDFALDLDGLAQSFGPRARDLSPLLSHAAVRYAPFVQVQGARLVILPEGRCLTRLIAAELDRHRPAGMRYSRAS